MGISQLSSTRGLIENHDYVSKFLFYFMVTSGFKMSNWMAFEKATTN